MAYEKRCLRALLFGCLIICSLRWKEDDLCISDHCSKWEITRHALRILFTFLLLITFTTSAFIHSSSPSTVLGHYLTVTANILFVFSLHNSNDIFSYQRSLPWEKCDSEFYHIFVLASRQGFQQLTNES